MIIKPKVPLILRRDVRDVYYMSCMCVHTQTLRHPHIWAYTFSHLVYWQMKLVAEEDAISSIFITHTHTH